LCVGGEDKKCADQYSVTSCNVADHLAYIGVQMGLCAIKNEIYQVWESIWKKDYIVFLEFHSIAI